MSGLALGTRPRAALGFGRAGVLGWLAMGVMAVGGALAAPADGSALFELANQKFALQQYTEAVASYELALARHGYSAPVLFNLANAYFRAGQVGPAILNYERARLLAPRDQEIVNNLLYVRRQAGLPVPVEGWVVREARQLTLSTWAWLASGCLGLLCASVLAQSLLRRRARLFLALSLLSGFTMLCAVGALGVGWQSVRRVGIAMRETPARISPVGSAEAAFSLAAGERVSLERAYHDFVLVRNQAGRVGWVEKGVVLAVIPGRAGSM